MSEKNSIEIFITDSRWPAYLKRLTTWAVIVLVPIGIGIVTHSAPMQWLGFLLTILILFSWLLSNQKSRTFNSIAAAKAYLDDLENEGLAVKRNPTLNFRNPDDI